MKTVAVIPTYNESENIAPLIKAIFYIAPEINICIVDDNSPDGTGQVVEDLKKIYPGLSVIHRPHKQGLGPAYIHGFQEVLKDLSVTHVLTMDGDFSHDPDSIPHLLSKAQNYDLVIGSRYIKGGGTESWEIWRRMLSRFANTYIRLILGMSVHDWTSGFNCINVSFLRFVDFREIDLSGYAFLQELKFVLKKLGAQIAEVPIIFRARRGGESKISSFIIREGILGPWKILLR